MEPDWDIAKQAGKFKAQSLVGKTVAAVEANASSLLLQFSDGTTLVVKTANERGWVEADSCELNFDIE